MKPTEDKDFDSAIRQVALDYLKPPFKSHWGYIYDSGSHMVADDGGPEREGHVLRIRGWGTISYLENPEQLQDKIGELVAEALTKFWNDESEATQLRARIVELEARLAVAEGKRSPAPDSVSIVGDTAWDDSREQFESWAEEKGFCLDAVWSSEGMPFEDKDTLLAFDIWNASRTAGYLLKPMAYAPINDPILCYSAEFDEFFIGYRPEDAPPGGVISQNMQSFADGWVPFPPKQLPSPEPEDGK